LESFVWEVNKSYLVAIDATGFFSSTNIRCDHCLIRELKTGSVKEIENEIRKQVRREMKEELKNKTRDQAGNLLKAKVAERLAEKSANGEITIEKACHHQLPGPDMVRPEQKISIPFCPEPIINRDGGTKNNCELNAAKRLLEQFRKEHPHLRVTITGDDLYSRATIIRLPGRYNMSYILVAKKSSHGYLFEYMDAIKEITKFEQEDLPVLETVELEESEGEKIVKKIRHKFGFVNGIPLNDSNEDIKVNFPEHWETEEYIDKEGIYHKNERFHSSWTTDIIITEDNVYQIMRGGRSRWNVENCVFNTPKIKGTTWNTIMDMAMTIFPQILLF